MRCEADQKEILFRRVPDDDFTPIVDGMCVIIKNSGKWIGEHGDCLCEGNAVLSQI